jgi:hypothetical protein
MILPFLPFPTDADPHLHVQPTLQQLFRDGTEVLRKAKSVAKSPNAMPVEMVGKLHKCGKDGKSPFLMGKSTINGHFQ